MNEDMLRDVIGKLPRLQQAVTNAAQTINATFGGAPPVLTLTAEERERIMGLVDALIAAELVIDGSPAATAERDHLYRELRAALGFEEEE